MSVSREPGNARADDSMLADSPLSGASAGVPMPVVVLRSRYELAEVIGHGDRSTIFRARDLHPAASLESADGELAVRLLHPHLGADPLARTRMKLGFGQMQSLTHPGIVRVFDLDCDGDACFMTMEFVPGSTVNAWIEAPHSRAEALRIIRECCVALEHAHSLGILHGDLKPGNVMVANDGTTKLLDFVPASVDARVTAPLDPAQFTAPLYASPQVLAGKGAVTRDDVFSLACLSYFILSGGRHPFGGRPSLEDGRAKSAPNHLREIPVALFDVIERGLSAERERRQESVREFLSELSDADRRERALGRSDITTGRDEIGPALLARAVAPYDDSRRRRPFATMMVMVFATAAAGIILQLAAHRDMTSKVVSPTKATAMLPELVTTAHAQSEAPSEVRPLPRDSGVISFEVATIHASAEQSLVAITVKRMLATRSSGAFVWRVVRGTAHPGVDYQPVDPQVVRFIEGQSIRTLFIPLLHTHEASAASDPRTFTVALEQVAGGPTLGRFARITVAIDPPPPATVSAAFQARALQ
jgi:serine/threonine protein kinase